MCWRRFKTLTTSACRWNFECLTHFDDLLLCIQHHSGAFFRLAVFIYLVVCRHPTFSVGPNAAVYVITLSLRMSFYGWRTAFLFTLQDLRSAAESGVYDAGKFQSGFSMACDGNDFRYLRSSGKWGHASRRLSSPKLLQRIFGTQQCCAVLTTNDESRWIAVIMWFRCRISITVNVRCRFYLIIIMMLSCPNSEPKNDRLR